MNRLAKYRRTPKGIAQAIYDRQKRSSKERGHEPPKYTRDELLSWMLSSSIFNDLYSDWINSDCDVLKKPSVDRLNDYEGYSFSNIQIMTWGENKRKGELDRMNGKNNKKNKAIVQYDVNGKIISEYHSIHHAGRISGVCCKNICRSIKQRGTAGGFVWDYVN